MKDEGECNEEWRTGEVQRASYRNGSRSLLFLWLALLFLTVLSAAWGKDWVSFLSLSLSKSCLNEWATRMSPNHQDETPAGSCGFHFSFFFKEDGWWDKERYVHIRRMNRVDFCSPKWAPLSLCAIQLPAGSLPIAAGITHQELSDLKQHEFIIRQFWRSGVRIRLPGLQPQCPQSCIPGGFRGHSFSCLLSF